ncbi:MAG: hypothetical protein NXY57DRAFT_196468 [Lentinula lateritia]|uniref:Zn(2)-C6 fungal-type domain-containing protein n=1 Tax=Lentinula lateritia TaxID=40482 RepID=A0ABQ8VR43_9AGAR|nr:MAG: hypothetical protein NXY57DRAFT_196468 [Lentinula lateritia]KAJ4498817.1 hypothetical protein C8R41DRAFT_915905 [Lentinula lateritia]
MVATLSTTPSSPPSSFVLELLTDEMSSRSSIATPRKFIFKEPTKQLRRGKACLNCRFHKIKCDGVRPVCGSCMRLPRDEECEYAGGPSRTKELEQRVTRLKARVRELESPELTDSGLHLSNPFYALDTGGLLSMPGSVAHSNSDHPSSSPRSSCDPLLGSPEPSVSIITMLLNNFLPSATQFGFFLHLERFRAAVLLKAHFNDSSRPSPALLNTTYLWGTHLSPVDALRSNETVFLNRALQQVSIEIPSAIHSAQIMHTIQAEVLLSTYFFRRNQLLEAEFHLSGAVSLAQSAGLHQIRSDRVFSSPVVSVLMETEMFLPPARDVIEEGERINGFWAVYCLHRLISITLGNTSKCFGGLDSPRHEVDTPWPQEYEAGLYDSGASGHSTIDFFIHGLSPTSDLNSELTSYTKAVVILHSVTALTHKFNRGIETENAYAAFVNECLIIESLITRFHSSLPSLHVDKSFLDSSSTPPSPSNSRSSRGVTHVLVSCAYMQMQKIFSSCGVHDALERSIGTAKEIIRILGDVNQVGLPHLNPIVGTLCVMACSVFGDELARTEMLGDWNLDNPSQINSNVLRQGLEVGMTTMSILAMDSPLMKYQMSKLQNSYPFIL